MRIRLLIAALALATPVGAQTSSGPDTLRAEGLAKLKERYDAIAVPSPPPRARQTPAAKAAVTAAEKRMEAAKKELRLDVLGPLQARFLRAGMDAMVYAVGDNRQTVRVEYIGFTRPMLFQLIEDGKFIRQIMDEIRPLGFKRLLLTDGYSSAENFEVR